MSELPRRLVPTRETIRRLFLLSGNQCAFPECTAPIIMEDGTYVGQVCHICAAEPGGERFDISQTNEQRREFENLLLMCPAHHVVTDDVDAYPVLRMKQLKAAHEARFQRGLASMENAESIQIVNSDVVLGGAGGAAHGAGGGGGGAIGPGARGGAGGNGGDLFQGTLEIAENCRALRVHIGEGGQGGTDGGTGAAGDDTVIEGVGDDGGVVKLLRIRGGGPGEGGAGRALVRWATLANSAEVRGGMLFILGGGWQRYQIGTLGEFCTFSVALVADCVSTLGAQLQLTLSAPDGDIVLSGAQRLEAPTGTQPIAFKLQVPFHTIGTWVVSLRDADEERYRLPFEVALTGGQDRVPAA